MPRVGPGRVPTPEAAQFSQALCVRGFAPASQAVPTSPAFDMPRAQRDDEGGLLAGDGDDTSESLGERAALPVATVASMAGEEAGSMEQVMLDGGVTVRREVKLEGRAPTDQICAALFVLGVLVFTAFSIALGASAHAQYDFDEKGEFVGVGECALCTRARAPPTPLTRSRARAPPRLQITSPKRRSAATRRARISASRCPAP